MRSIKFITDVTEAKNPEDGAILVFLFAVEESSGSGR